MRRDFSRTRRQIGKLRESQMYLIGAETCRMYATCALGLCVAGLRGQLRKLPFGVSACYAGLAPPVVHLGWVACSGVVFPDLKSSEFDLSMALSTATFVSDMVSACRLPWLSRSSPRRLSTSCLCRADPQPLGSRTAGGTAPAQPLHLPQTQRFLVEVLGAGRGLHLGASATTLCNVRLFSSRSAESLLLNPRILDISANR
jgi:hypothetical protein